MVIKLSQLVRKTVATGKRFILVDWRYGSVNTRLMLYDPETRSITFYVAPTALAEPVLAKALENIAENKYTEVEILVDSISQRVQGLKVSGGTVEAEEMIKYVLEAKMPYNHVLVLLEAAQLYPLGDRYMISEGPITLNMFKTGLYVLSQKYLEGLEKELMERGNPPIKAVVGLTLRPVRAAQLGITVLDEQTVAQHTSSLSSITTVFLFIPLEIVSEAAELEAEPAPSSGSDGDGRVEQGPGEQGPTDGDEELKKKIKAFMSQVLEDAGER